MLPVHVVYAAEFLFFSRKSRCWITLGGESNGENPMPQFARTLNCSNTPVRGYGEHGHFRVSTTQDGALPDLIPSNLFVPFAHLLYTISLCALVTSECPG
jgi:hypothetical protein